MIVNVIVKNEYNKVVKTYENIGLSYKELNLFTPNTYVSFDGEEYLYISKKLYYENSKDFKDNICIEKVDIIVRKDSSKF